MNNTFTFGFYYLPRSGLGFWIFRDWKTKFQSEESGKTF